MKFSPTRLEPSQVQLAPMIDILFLLLTFFIVSWSFSRAENDLRVAVPVSEGGAEPPRAVNEIVVNVGKDGAIYVSGQQLTRQQFQTRIEAIARVNKSQPVRMRGDASASYQTFMEVLAIVNRAGISNISFATELPRQN